MSLPTTKGFHEKFGFEVKDKFEIDLSEYSEKDQGYGKFTLYRMVRPAQK